MGRHLASAKAQKLFNQLSNERCLVPVQIEKVIKQMWKSKNEMIAILVMFFQALLAVPLIEAIRLH